MGYHIQDNEVFRSCPGDSILSEDEDEETEEDNEEAPPEEEGGQEDPHEATDPTEEPHTMPMDSEPADRGRGATFSTAFECRMEQWMDNVDSQLQSMQSDIKNLTQDFTQFNLNYERMRFQLDHQSQLL